MVASEAPGAPARTIVLVDHGSRRSEAHDAFARVADDVARALPDAHIEIAHLEVREPRLGAVLDRCAASGTREIIVYPYFLGPGKHTSEDIPNELAAARERHPSARFELLEPLGSDPRLTELVVARLR